MDFPEGTDAVRVFVAGHTAQDIYFDEVSFKQNDKYHYIDYTVDGNFRAGRHRWY